MTTIILVALALLSMVDIRRSLAADTRRLRHVARHRVAGTAPDTYTPLADWVRAALAPTAHSGARGAVA